MLGGTSDIIQLWDHGFYDWFMFRENPIQYPDKKLMLGRYLGPGIDVNPAMIAKIMKANGKVVHHLTYHGLKEYKKSNQAHKYLSKVFDNSNRDRLRPDISQYTFPGVN